MNARIVLPNKQQIQITQNGQLFGRNELMNAGLQQQVIKYVSRQHFRVYFDNTGFYIEDAGSSGGTKLNNADIKDKGRQPLKNDDQIVLSNTLWLTFQI